MVLGLKEGESHVIRNAGGRAPEAIRSLVISQQLLGTKEILVIQHTDCGMLTFTTEQARNLVTTNLSLQSGSTSKNYIDNLNFLDFSNLEANIKSDVDFLKSNELIRVSSDSVFSQNSHKCLGGENHWIRLRREDRCAETGCLISLLYGLAKRTGLIL